MLSKLKPRQRDVLLLLACNLGTKQVAWRLGISQATVVYNKYNGLREWGRKS